MKISQTEIDKIIPYARNPRKNDEAIAKVAASLKEFGWQQPIVVDNEMVVVAGHTRLAAARTLGMDAVPVVIADNLTPAQVKAYRLADNRVGQEAEWDDDLLRLEINDLEAENYNLTETGFDVDELGKLFGEDNDIGSNPDNIVTDEDKNMIVIEVDTEAECAELYEELKERGINCKLMS